MSIVVQTTYYYHQSWVSFANFQIVNKYALHWTSGAVRGVFDSAACRVSPAVTNMAGYCKRPKAFFFLEYILLSVGVERMNEVVAWY